MRIIIYGSPGDGTAFSAIGQIRSICSRMKVEATIQMITDPLMQQAQGVTALPSIEVEGSFISYGYMPSRSEIERTIRQKSTQH
jgi:hypothetical protein